MMKKQYDYKMKPQGYIKVSFLSFLFLFLLNTTFAQRALSTKEATAFKEKATKAASEIKTITSNFGQKKHLDFLSNDIESFGKMVFKMPDLIKWEYTNPFQYSVVFKEDKLFINDEGNKSDVDLSSSKVFKSMNNLIAKSIKGNMFDDDEFEIAYFAQDDNYMVSFKPFRKEINEFIKEFQLIFDKETANVMEVKMIEPTDDYTRIIFSDRLLNTAVADEAFNN